MLFGYLYTGKPFPIVYTPFGEICCGFFMGPIIIGISYFVQTLTLPSNVIFISIPVGLFVAGIMLTNNIRDLDGDKESGRKTLAILLGRKKSIRILAFFFVLSYGLTALYIIFGMLPLLSTILFITAFQAYDVVKKIRGKTKPIEMEPAMSAMRETYTSYGFLLVLSILVNMFI